ncbi:MAG: amidohydrolase [Frankiales bacterium]|jgi:predicted TIM-barrel fold metal-dependent hydrolase|nr:amidohydrolase [Frankiales bacterium]
MSTDLAEVVEHLPLVDHHVHGASRCDLARDELASHLTEATLPPPAGTSQFESQVGFALRRWCAPLLDLPAHAEVEAYVARRAELGAAEVNRRLLVASGIDHFLVETGYRADEIYGPAEMAAAAGARAGELVRLESVAEELSRTGVGAGEFASRYVEELWTRTTAAVGLKSIIAYRHGLDFAPERPAPDAVRTAAGAWLAEMERTGQARISDPVLLRHLLWAGVDRGLPLQFHVGYGDPDLELHRCDPLLMTGFLRAIQPRGIPVLLLHCYPFHRQAGYLAQVFPDVYLDVGLAVNYTGARSAAVVAESLELAPFSKLLFSTDAWGPAELHYLGARLWRRAFTRVVQRWIDDGDWSPADAVRVAELVGFRNAERVYQLDGPP